MHALLPHFDGAELASARRGDWCYDYATADHLDCPGEIEIALTAAQLLWAIDIAARESENLSRTCTVFAAYWGDTEWHAPDRANAEREADFLNRHALVLRHIILAAAID
jgi:hypothetical protein